ncbi:MAG: O-antigen polymerase [Candidatus Faecousia sp.]|nr:O-antigen polymerase [Candidatus Faecousia sp.]
MNTRRLDRASVGLISISLIFILTIVLLILMPTEIDEEFADTWLACTFSLAISLFVLLHMYMKYDLDFFSPVVYVSLLYLIMFFVTPIYDITVGETDCFGVTDLFLYGVKGSFVALAGFLSFCFFYQFRQNRLLKKPEPVQELKLSDADREKLAQNLLAAWVLVVFLAIVLTVFTTGFSISYMLSFGLTGSVTDRNSNHASLGFLIQFTRCIVTIAVLYFCYSKNKTLRYVVLFVTALVEVSNGFRYMIVILLVSVFYVQYLVLGRKIKIGHAIMVLVLLMLIIGLIGYTRDAVRRGEGADTSGFSLKFVFDALLSNFRIYKSYYGVIKAVPQIVPYIYFDQIVVYTLIMAIPRAIWKGKPTSSNSVAQLYGLNYTAVQSGFAYPCIGEYFEGFGLFGVLFFMGCYGAWLSRISVKYRIRCRCAADYVYYAVIVATMLQLIIRGYTPSNFYLVVTLSVPYWLTISYIKKHAEVEETHE